MANFHPSSRSKHVHSKIFDTLKVDQDENLFVACTCSKSPDPLLASVRHLPVHILDCGSLFHARYNDFMAVSVLNFFTARNSTSEVRFSVSLHARFLEHLNQVSLHYMTANLEVHQICNIISIKVQPRGSSFVNLPLPNSALLLQSIAKSILVLKLTLCAK